MRLYVASCGSLLVTAMMSAGRMPPSTRARISALVALPSLIQLSGAAGLPTFVKSVVPPTLATYSVPEDRSFSLSATKTK